MRMRGSCMLSAEVAEPAEDLFELLQDDLEDARLLPGSEERERLRAGGVAVGVSAFEPEAVDRPGLEPRQDDDVATGEVRVLRRALGELRPRGGRDPLLVEDPAGG